MQREFVLRRFLTRVNYGFVSHDIALQKIIRESALPEFAVDFPTLRIQDQVQETKIRGVKEDIAGPIAPQKIIALRTNYLLPPKYLF